jgi:transcriptional regulator with XRE-family HTH domain
MPKAQYILTDEDLQIVTSMYKDGRPQREIAEKLGVSQSYISLLVNQLGLPGTVKGRPKLRRAAGATIEYNRERRIALNDAWFKKIEELLRAAHDIKGIRDLAIAYGIIEDKRHLLEPTDKKEVDLLAGLIKVADERAKSEVPSASG